MMQRLEKEELNYAKQLNDAIRNPKEPLLSFHERNIIFEKQLKVLVNLVPFDVQQSLLHDMITPLHFNFLAPNEILDGNSLSVYTITDPNYVSVRLESINDEDEKKFYKQSLI